MKILGIETATLAGGVALMEEGGLIAEYRLHVELRYSERLLSAIDRLFAESKTALSDLDAIAVSIGPGSFTGLRVGLATAKGLATGGDKPLVLVPTLEAMAAAFPYSKALVAPMISARRDEVYWALFDLESGAPERLCPDAASAPLEALDRIVSFDREIVFVGDGAMKYREDILEGHPSALFAPRALQFPSPASVAELGLLRFAQGKISSPADAAPAYLRASQAELKWEASRGKISSNRST